LKESQIWKDCALFYTKRWPLVNPTLTGETAKLIINSIVNLIASLENKETGRECDRRNNFTVKHFLIAPDAYVITFQLARKRRRVKKGRGCGVSRRFSGQYHFEQMRCFSICLHVATKAKIFKVHNGTL
jgi:hypothetical protein